MTYLALARKWRPRQFSEVAGQEHVVTALSNALDSKRVHHAYLFTGTRGVGKTTLARIFAKSLNCETGVSAEPCQVCSVCTSVDNGNYVDLIEVDAASRTGIDDMRELLDNVQYAPTSGSYKVYLIDEVHMLSKSSFNALLKTLEEPPEHVKFLFATTDPQKLPVTVLSRCLQFSLLALQPSQITKQINKILDAENIAYEDSAIEMISRAAAGSMRDSLSLLEQAIAQGNGKVEEESVRAMLGVVKSQYIDALLDSLLNNESLDALKCTEEMAAYAVDFTTALDQLLLELHHISLAQISPKTLVAKQLDEEKYLALAKRISPEQIQLFYQIALMGKRDIALAPDPRSGFEMVLMRLLAFNPKGQGDSDQPVSGGSTQANSAKSQQPSVAQAAAGSTAVASAGNVGSVDSAPKTDAPVSAPTQKIAEQTNNSETNAETISLLKTNKPEQPKEIPVPKVRSEADLPPANVMADKASTPEVADIRQVSPGKMEPQLGGSETVPDINVEPKAAANNSSPRQYATSPQGNPKRHEEPKFESRSNHSASPQTSHKQHSPQSDQSRFEPRMAAPAQQSARHNEPQFRNQSVNPQQENQSANSATGDEEYSIPVEPASTATWAGMVEQLHLNGLIKEFAMNIACDDIAADPMMLYLDPGYKFLFNPKREESVFNEIRKVRPGNYEIKIVFEKSISETPSERLRRMQVEKRDHTKDVMMQDKGMTGLMDTFGLSINDESIKPK